MVEYKPFHVVVTYDSQVVFDDYVIVENVEDVVNEVVDIIYNDGLINPYLHSVYQKLSFNIEQV